MAVAADRLSGLPSVSPRPVVTAVGLAKTFETSRCPVQAIRKIDLTVNAGELVAIVGPSGCGKTTLLRIIAALERQTSGTLELAAPSGKSELTRAMVFQGRSVFPWMTVRENTGYGLQLLGVPKSERHQRVDELLLTVGLSNFAKAYPHQISEGMRQRTAIARALAVNPDLLLMDEPFGALDEQTRFILQDELLRIWERTGKTILVVTHSIDEALTLADRIVVLTAHPGSVKATIQVPLGRPRDQATIRTDPQFAVLFSQIWGLLRDEVQAARAEERR